MTRTILSSATTEVIIGFDQPFVIIGERINPTGRKILAAEMTQGNFKRAFDNNILILFQRRDLREGNLSFFYQLH